MKMHVKYGWLLARAGRISLQGARAVALCSKQYLGGFKTGALVTLVSPGWSRKVASSPNQRWYRSQSPTPTVRTHMLSLLHTYVIYHKGSLWTVCFYFPDAPFPFLCSLPAHNRGSGCRILFMQSHFKMLHSCKRFLISNKIRNFLHGFLFLSLFCIWLFLLVYHVRHLGSLVWYKQCTCTMEPPQSQTWSSMNQLCIPDYQLK